MPEMTPSLLIIDEIGYLTVGASAGNLFFQLVNARYEKGAMILTSDRLGSANGGKFLGDPVVATALLRPDFCTTLWSFRLKVPKL